MGNNDDVLSQYLQLMEIDLFVTSLLPKFSKIQSKPFIQSILAQQKHFTCYFL